MSYIPKCRFNKEKFDFKEEIVIKGCFEIYIKTMHGSTTTWIPQLQLENNINSGFLQFTSFPSSWLVRIKHFKKVKIKRCRSILPFSRCTGQQKKKSIESVHKQSMSSLLRRPCVMCVPVWANCSSSGEVCRPQIQSVWSNLHE